VPTGSIKKYLSRAYLSIYLQRWIILRTLYRQIGFFWFYSNLTGFFSTKGYPDKSNELAYSLGLI